MKGQTQDFEVNDHQAEPQSPERAVWEEKGSGQPGSVRPFPLTRMRLALRMSSAVKVVWVGTRLSSCCGCRCKVWVSGSCSREDGVSCGSWGTGMDACSGWSSPFRAAGSASSNCSFAGKCSKSWISQTPGITTRSTWRSGIQGLLIGSNLESVVLIYLRERVLLHFLGWPQIPRVTRSSYISFLSGRDYGTGHWTQLWLFKNDWHYGAEIILSLWES